MMWTVYAHPRDFPSGYIARRAEIFPNRVVPTSDVRTGPTLESVRDQLPPGLFRQERRPDDDPVIVEVWF